MIDSFVGGQCDSCVAAFINLSSNYYDNYQADLVYPQDCVGSGGHSFVYIPAGDNHIIFDKTYEFIFVGSGNNSHSALHGNKY